MPSDLLATTGIAPSRRRGRPPGTTRSAEEPHVEAVERALAILEAFDSAHAELTLSDLSARTGFYPSTVLRLSASLGRFGYLRRGADGRFRLGAAPLRLGAVYRGAFSLTEHVRPALATLVAETGETAVFYVREGERRICLYRHHPLRAVHHHVEEGAALPLELGAGGRVLLAFSSRPDTPSGAEVRRRGYAVSLGERDSDAAAVAAPVFGAPSFSPGIAGQTPPGALVGAIGVAGVASRLRETDLPALGRHVRAAAATLSAELGGSWPAFSDD